MLISYLPHAWLGEINGISPGHQEGLFFSAVQKLRLPESNALLYIYVEGIYLLDSLNQESGWLLADTLISL